MSFSKNCWLGGRITHSFNFSYPKQPTCDNIQKHFHFWSLNVNINLFSHLCISKSLTPTVKKFLFLWKIFFWKLASDMLNFIFCYIHTTDIMKCLPCIKVLHNSDKLLLEYLPQIFLQVLFMTSLCLLVEMPNRCNPLCYTKENSRLSRPGFLAGYIKFPTTACNRVPSL